MTMWDTANGKLLRNLTDVHTPNHGVLLLAFTDDPATAVVTDTGGSVFEVNFKKILTRSYESNCIFSGRYVNLLFSLFILGSNKHDI